MTFVTREELVRQIHGVGRRLVLSATGGGSQAISDLLSVGGASNTVLAATVPYAASALAAWLGATPEHYCCDRTARAMAMVGYRRAVKLAPDEPNVVGIGCTASLASDRPKRGAHRVYLAVQTADVTATTAWEFVKGRRTRAEEEDATARAILNLIAQHWGLCDSLALDLGEDEPCEARAIAAPACWQDLLAGRLQLVPATAAAEAESPRVLLPGAFQPLHAGHRQMARLAEQMTGSRVAFELSMFNVDKPPLDYLEIDRRLGQFDSAQDAVWLSDAATFITKSKLLPGATFVVGADTIVRIAEPRYYGDAPAAVEAAIAGLAERDCRFLVFGRKLGQQFCTLGDLQLPASLAHLCQEIPGAAFREDISSTALRQSGEW